MRKLIVVDGYNVIYKSSSLRKMLKKSPYQAQMELVNLVLNYCSSRMMEAYVVFDAYRRPCSDTEETISSKLKVIFTGKGKTADSYIEEFIFQKKSFYDYIYVVTSDYSQGMTVMDKKVLPISPKNFLEELNSHHEVLRERYLSSPESRVSLSDYLERETRKKLENLRGK
ncbi:NYN domain-containing protein [Candidatus Aerophobetes bacterium]|nr:NYN domain-containing protein [Candidatus Aerophobetes bacterium]